MKNLEIDIESNNVLMSKLGYHEVQHFQLFLQILRNMEYESQK
jgi:hypothetical protein